MSRNQQANDGSIDGDGDETDADAPTTDGRQPAAGPSGGESRGHAAGGFSRRGALAALTGLGAIGLGAGTASAGATLEFDNSYSGNTTNGDHALKLVNDDSTGVEFGLKAYSKSEDGRGVLGKATNSTGENYGVIGKAEGTSDLTSGVYGFATGAQGRTYGVKGRTSSASGRGTLGRASSSSGDTYGVVGLAESSSGTGVWGKVDSLDGSPTGVHGLVYNAANGIAVHGEHRAGGLALKAEGDADVTGVLTVGKLGAEASLSSDQTIAQNTWAQVNFSAQTDDRGEFSSGDFQAKHDGAYLVTTQVTWKGTTIGANDVTKLRIRHYDDANSTTTTVARNSRVTPSSDDYSLELSKTIRGVSKNDLIYVEVREEGSSQWDLLGNPKDTWLEVSQIA